VQQISKPIEGKLLIKRGLPTKGRFVPLNAEETLVPPEEKPIKIKRLTYKLA